MVDGRRFAKRFMPQLPGFTELLSGVDRMRLRTVSRWLGLGIVVGALSGLVAIGFFVGMSWLSHLVLDIGANYHPLEPSGEPSLFGHELDGPIRRWVLVLAPALGGLLAGLIVFRFAPEAEGHGTDALIQAFHSNRPIRARIPIVKGLASILVIGTGGSAGREGPIAQIGGGLGAILGKALKLSDRERRLLLLSGAAGGIAAIFRTPLGAALFVIEVLYRDDTEVDAFVPAVLTSVVGYSTFTSLMGQGTMFGVTGNYVFDPRQLPLYVLMAVGCALVGILYVKSFYGARDHVFQKLKLPRALKPAIGGLGVGLLTLVTPHALGAGYGVVQQILSTPTDFVAGGWQGARLLLGIALLKIVTTSLSVSSGGSGGVFGPSVVIGGLVGGAFGLMFQALFPALDLQPDAFVIVGMACFVGGVAHAPLGTLVMASEMTGSYQLLVPLMLSEAVTFVILRPWTLFEKQVPSRKDSEAHFGEHVLDVLRDLTVKDAFQRGADVQTVSAGMPIEELLRKMSESSQAVLPVMGKDGAPRGLVTLDSLRTFLFDEDIAKVAIAADCEAPFVALVPDDTLSVALDRFMATRCRQLPVMQSLETNEIIGLLSYEDLLRTYDQELVRRGIKTKARVSVHGI